MRMVVHAFFPALIMLRLADSNSANMDKSYFYVRQLDKSLETSKQLLDAIPADTEYMKLVSRVRKSDLVPDNKESESSDNEEAVDVVEAAQRAAISAARGKGTSSMPTTPPVTAVVTPTLGSYFVTCWNKCKQKLCHDFAMAGWIVSPIPHICNDVKRERNQRVEREATERLFIKLFRHKANDDATLGQMIDHFWSEVDSFHSHMGIYDRHHIWNSQDLKDGISYLWHKKYSYHHTEYFG